MIEDMIALLILFQGRVPDKESNLEVLDLVQTKDQWAHAYDIFSSIRAKTLTAEKNKDKLKLLQYSFEEVCAKSVYNLFCYAYEEEDPFDLDSPYWVIKNALYLAHELNIDEKQIINIVAPTK